MRLNASERGSRFRNHRRHGHLVTALAGVAQLFILGTHLTRQAGASGRALVAAGTVESLREPFTYDPGSLRHHSALRSPSTLAEDTEPYVDWLDIDGVAQAPMAQSVRRWPSRLSATTPDAIAIEVCVFTSADDRRCGRVISDSNEAAMKSAGFSSSAADRDDGHVDRRSIAGVAPHARLSIACLQTSICSSVAEPRSICCRRQFARPERTSPRRNRLERSAIYCQPFRCPGR
jgi:hypothetical protein